MTQTVLKLLDLSMAENPCMTGAWRRPNCSGRLKQPSIVDFPPKELRDSNKKDRVIFPPKKRSSFGGFLQMVGFPNKPMSFPAKNDQHLGCEMGVPPFKETPVFSHQVQPMDLAGNPHNEPGLQRPCFTSLRRGCRPPSYDRYRRSQGAPYNSDEKRALGCLGFMGDDSTTQIYRDHNKP